MEFGIAFEGCAGRAAFHVGVVEELSARGLRPRAVAGASSGAIVAATLACGRAGGLAELWLGSLRRRFYDPRRLLRGRWPFAMSDILGDALGRELAGWRTDTALLPLEIAVTVWQGGRFRRRLLGPRDRVGVVEAVLASCYIPGPYARMVPIAGRPALDGAWQVRTPVDGLPRELPRIAVVTNTGGRLEGGFPRTISLRPEPGVTVLAPREELPVRGFQLARGLHERCIAIGRRSAAEFLDAQWSVLQAGQCQRSSRRSHPPRKTSPASARSISAAPGLP